MHSPFYTLVNIVGAYSRADKLSTYVRRRRRHSLCTFVTCVRVLTAILQLASLGRRRPAVSLAAGSRGGGRRCHPRAGR